MGVITYCECGLELTEEEVKTVKLHPCTLLHCTVKKIRKQKERQRRRGINEDKERLKSRAERLKEQALQGEEG